MSSQIQLLDKPKLKRPYFIAAWPGMGSVAVTAVEYLRDQLGAKLLGEMPAEDFFTPTGATVSKQIIQAPELPTNKFYYYQSSSSKRDILFFLGSVQPIPHKEHEFSEKILQIAQSFDVQMVITTAAAPTDMYFRDKPRVFAAPNDGNLIKMLMEYKVHFMGNGNIAGLNGLLIAVAREMGLKGVCFLGEIPFFTAQVEFPQASVEILQILMQILNLKIDMVDLELYAGEKEKEIEPLAKLLMKENQKEEEEEKEEVEERQIEHAEQDVPRSARVKIEKLFRQAEFDGSYKSKMKLKEELDKWDLFDDYLDRFLDLFKKGKEES